MKKLSELQKEEDIRCTFIDTHLLMAFDCLFLRTGVS